MDTTENVLAQAAALLANVTGVPALDDFRLVQVMELTENVGRLIDRLRISTAAEIADRSRHELGSTGLSYRLGQRRPGHLIEQRTRVSAAEAARRIRLGGLVRVRSALDGSPLPPLYAHVAEALATGLIGTDAAAQITFHLQQAAERCPPDDLFNAEKLLVQQALTESADLVGIAARMHRDMLDADGAEPRDEQLRLQAEIRLGRPRNGMTPIIGQADPINAAKLHGMFNAYLAPGATIRFVDPDGNFITCPDSPAQRGTGDLPAGDVPADTRTVGQRNFDILIGVLTAGLTADKSIPRSKTTIIATIRVEDYTSGRGVGWLDGIEEPISAASIQELGCDADTRLLLLGTHGEVLALGHKIRLFSYAQRLALAARDGGCIWPNCTAPPAWCDAHHVIPHGGGHNGPTNIDNGVLLCPAHHHMLHHCDMTLTMKHGTPKLLPPNRLTHSGHAWTTSRSRISQALRR